MSVPADHTAQTSPAPSGSRLRRVWTPALVLAASLLATALGTTYVRRASRTEERIRFENAVQLTTQHIKGHLSAYVALLNGAEGFFTVHQPITRAAFHRYVERLELEIRYPGIQGLGFAKRVPAGEEDELINWMRQQGVADFQIWPRQDRAEYYPITYLEPRDWRNRRALGFDMASEPVRRAAMEQAADTARAAASGKVRLVQETDDQPQAGFLMYIPVYREDGAPGTLDERRSALDGFVYCVFRADNLLKSILQNDARVDVRLYDTSPDKENVLCDSRRFGTAPPHYQPAGLAATSSFNIAGHTFALRLVPGPSFGGYSAIELPVFTLLAGLALSTLLYGATSSLAKARSAAERTAAELHHREAMRARRGRHLALRAEVGEALTATDASTREILQRCAQAAAHQLDVAFVRIWTFNPDTDTLELQASAGLDTHLDGKHARVRVGDLKIGRIAQHRSPQISNDVPNDPAVSDPNWARAQELTAFAGFPLLVEGRLLGVLALYARESLAEDTLDAIAATAELLAQGIDRKRAAEALRDSEERLRATFDQAAVGIVLSSPEGRFELANQRFREIVGCSSEELPGKTWKDLIHPNERDAYAELSKRLLAGQISTFSMESRCLSRTGSIVWVIMSVSAVRNPAGRTDHTMSVVRDITARKHAEQTVLEQKRELEDFVSIVAHDLKHPVVSVQGLLGLLKQQASHLLDEDNREDLSMALSECNRMKDIIAQLGNIARIGSAEVRPEPVHLHAFLQNAVRRFGRRIEEKGAEVSIEAPELTALFPRLQVEEALDNLLDNALQYGCAGTSPRICLRCTAEDSAVAIAVADNGPGIDPRFHKRVFEMFRRLDPTGPGTGVGLTSVQRLIRRIGGAVALDSAVDRGATFTIRFPAQIIKNA